MDGKVTPLPLPAVPDTPQPQGKWYSDQDLAAVLIAHERALRASARAPSEPQPPRLRLVRS